MSEPPIRVAQYVRMSTDKQEYSTQNQAAAIEAYALLHGMVVVREYVDAGKSGLHIEGRAGLQALLSDVRSGAVDYEAVLVYDVSRWGRFQNTDESAHYEYLLFERGIKIHYVTETFNNDGSPMSTMVKGIKRSMAGEYSRELSVKVFAGHCRLVELGFHQGGKPGFGLRRNAVSATREAKNALALHERKAMPTDRVILAPGPQQEVDVVRDIYNWFALDRISEAAIAVKLNVQAVRKSSDLPWSREDVHRILISERYIGNNTYNRVSSRMKSKKHIAMPPERWIRSDGCYVPVISNEIWNLAQQVFLERSLKLSDDELLSLLRALRDREGTLSGVLIDEQHDMPPASAYRRRFGGLERAYSLIGYDRGIDNRHREENKALRAMHPNVVRSVVDGFENSGASVHLDPGSCLLTINDQWTATVTLSRCSTAGATHHWFLRFDESLKPDLTVCVRMKQDNTEPLDYYVFSRLHLEMLKRSLQLRNRFSIDAFRFDDLNPLYELGQRVQLQEAA